MSKALTLQSVLGKGGALEGAFAGYEHRPEQLNLAHAVWRALSERSYLVAEAGTGTGKTWAYLVPSILSGRRIVLSTATKTLQEQIFWKDLPMLREIVGLKSDAACLKGQSNYLCLHRFERFDQAPNFANPQEASLWPRLRAWALETTTGDRAEVELPEAFTRWGHVSSTKDNCLGSKCALYESCHVTRARRRAEESNLIVVNHSLFFADLALRTQQQGQEGILPSYDAVIFDEAHALEETAVQHFGRHVSSARVSELTKDTLEALPPEDTRAQMLSALALKVRGDAERFFGSLSSVIRKAQAGAIRLNETSLRPVRSQLDPVLESLAALGSLASSAESPTVFALSRRSMELRADLEFIASGERKDHVYWAEERTRSFHLRASPIDVAAELQKRLYARADTLIFTSATLAAGGSFDFFHRRLGLASSARENDRLLRDLMVPSPFDFSSQAALYLPGHLPRPEETSFAEAVAEELISLCRVTQGRAFALFTSLRNMQAVYRLCRHRLGVPALLQGDKPKTALLDEFRASPSVLFAAHSFWEGVDVPGSALSLVVMDKLPFSSPGDPMVAARIDQLRDAGEDPFSSYQLPEAAVALRQGFGRLIRTRTDRGIVAIMDPRLTSKAYGRSLLAGLPPARRFTAQAPLEKWFNGSGL